MHNNLRAANEAGIALYLVLLTFFFILLEISFFIQCNQTYLSDFTYVSGELTIPRSILPGILFFLIAQLAIHAFYFLTVWFAAVFCSFLGNFNRSQAFYFALALWCVGVVGALSANQYYFPNSKFAELTSLIFISATFAAGVATLCAAIFALALITGFIGCLMWVTYRSFKVALLGLMFLVATAWIGFRPLTVAPLLIVKQDKPNVIIIGIDSLRPDFLGFFGAENRTPFLDHLLEASTVFSEAVTPLARTFPSWVSILTGEHPHESGVRSNLMNVDNVDTRRTLPTLLKQHGYVTMYATDETRFSNIDERFGFDVIVTPPIGLNDFLLGTFNDFPLSNLVVNTKVGRWLFPYSYANRPAFVTYNPDSFIELMRPALMKTHSQPLFLAAHFCLPHYPYLWATLNSHDVSPLARYQASVARVDQQLQSFFHLLSEAHLLDQAIVVVLSDHGEALELSGDRLTELSSYQGKLDSQGEVPHFYPPNLAEERVNQSAGHGTDVLGLTQYHTLLAFRLFGYGSQHQGEVAGIVPLSDIKQTLLSLTGLSPISSPMAAMIRGKRATASLRHVLIESDYSPESIRTVYPETRQVMLEGVQLYEINPRTTRLTLKDHMGKMIIKSKQYADIYGKWMLAFYPQNTIYHMPILINLETGQWTNDLQSNFAQGSPSRLMQSKLKDFYQSELSDVQN